MPARTFASLADLLQPGVRVACGNPDATAIGNVHAGPARTFRAMGVAQPPDQRSGVFKPTVNEVANDVKLGSVDAGIVWDATAVAVSRTGGGRAAGLAAARPPSKSPC